MVLHSFTSKVVSRLVISSDIHEKEEDVVGKKNGGGTIGQPLAAGLHTGEGDTEGTLFAASLLKTHTRRS